MAAEASKPTTPRVGRGFTPRHTDVAEWRVNSRSMFVVVYLPLPTGDYTIWDPDPERPTRITLKPGIVNELDWR